MKTLLVMRHAKSSWDNEGLDDFERPLNDRGKVNAPEMARRLAARNAQPDLIVHSAAARTTKTAQLVAQELTLDDDSVISHEDLYLAGPETLLEFTQLFSDSHDVIMIIGHNPGVTAFVNALCNEDIDNIVTAGIAITTFECNAWSEIAFGAGTLIDYDYPKRVT